MGTDGIQKVTVVGYDQDDIFVACQEVFQPGDRIDIQVVGRLIQDQDIRISESRLCQQDPDLLVTVQFVQ